MALTGRLINAARVHLTNVTDAALNAELFAVVDEACRDGFIWRETITVPFLSGISTYAIAPTDTEVVHVFSVSHPVYDMTGVSVEFGSATVPFAVTAAHEAAEAFYAVAALTPSLEAADPESFLPKDMWSEHHRMLLAGLLSRMMLQPLKPFTNPQLGVGHRRMFRALLAEAKHKAKTGGVPGAQLWRFPRFA